MKDFYYFRAALPIQYSHWYLCIGGKVHADEIPGDVLKIADKASADFILKDYVEAEYPGLKWQVVRHAPDEWVDDEDPNTLSDHIRIAASEVVDASAALALIEDWLKLMARNKRRPLVWFASAALLANLRQKIRNLNLALEYQPPTEDKD
ncbi:hypothetical protein GF380_00280 [Candidatus Uhrbacteria bacterium]|nr:hypothetical protein [Candidatus Uhrbacteria bacterium]